MGLNRVGGVAPLAGLWNIGVLPQASARGARSNLGCNIAGFQPFRNWRSRSGRGVSGDGIGIVSGIDVVTDVTIVYKRI